MAIRTAVALSDRRSPQRTAVTPACPAYFIGSEIHGSPGTVKVFVGRGRGRGGTDGWILWASGVPLPHTEAT